MSRIRGVAQFAFLAACSAVISCASDSSSVEIQDVVDRIVVSLGLSTLTVGQTVQAGAIAQTASGGALSGVALTWATSNPAIVTVTPAGMVTAVAPGSATITAAAQGKSASVNVTVVVAPVASVAVSLSTTTAAIGQAVTATATTRDASNNTLTGRTVTWTSSNNAVATVNASSGSITTVGAGTTNIVATSEGITGAAILTVQAVSGVPVASIDVTLGNPTVPPGLTTTATATVRDAANNILTGRPITWNSSDITIATVTASGVVTGVTSGTASITATSEGITGSAPVTVRAQVATVSVALASIAISVTGTTTATATVKDPNGTVLTDRTVTWTSGNSSIATVSSAGVVSGVATGTTIITGTADGVPGSATLNVQVAAASVVVALGTTTLKTGSTTIATATVRDAAGGLLAGRTVTWTSSNSAIATVGIDGVVTGVANGSADITGIVDGALGSATVTVSATGGGTTSSATQLAITTQPGGAISGNSFSTQPVVEIRDANNVRVATANNLVFASIASGTGALAGATAVAVNGIATFTNLRIDGAGPHTLTFSSTGLTSATSGSVTVTQVPASLTIQTQPGGAVTGVPLTTQPVVRILDNAGLPIANSTLAVTATIGSGNGSVAGTTTVNAVGGVATFTNLQVNGSGNIALRFSTAAPAMQVLSAAFPVAQGAATQLAIVTQPAGAASGVLFTTQPVVQVRDASNAVVVGSTISVTAVLATGSGSLAGTTTVNAVNGVATFTDLRIIGAGAYTLRFTATGLTAATSSTVNVTQTAASLSVQTQPGNATSGAPFGTQPVIRVLDGAGQLVTGFTGSVQVSIASGTGTLGGSVVINAVGGIATFTNLQITGSGAFTLRFQITEPVLQVISASFNVAASGGAATQLVLSVQPTGAVSGVNLTTQPVVQIRDASNAVVTNSSAPVAATLNGAGGTLSGTTTVSAVNGVATFTNLKVTGAGQYTITFASAGLTSATSATITVAAAQGQTATQLAITTQPGGAASGANLTPQPVVQVRDAANAVVTASSAPVTATLNGAGGTLSGTTTVSAVNGVATFTNLKVTGSGSHTITFASAGLTAATSANFNVTTTSTSATQLTMSTQPSSAVETGGFLPQAPTVQLRDASNAAVSQSGIVITAAIATGGGTLGGTLTATTNASGAATFANLSITGTGGIRTLTFSAAGLTSATSANINVTVPVLVTPNVLNNASFESGWDGFTDWTLAAPPTQQYTRDNTLAYSGSYSLKRAWAPTPVGQDAGGQLSYNFPSQDRVWVRFYIRLTQPITSVMKFMRFFAPGWGDQLGGLFIGSGSDIFTFGSESENYEITTEIGLTQAQVADGNWHSVEVDYWRNGDPSGWPSAAFWFDGKPLYMPDGTYVKYSCAQPNPPQTCNMSYWKGGRLQSGQRSRALSDKLSIMEWVGTINGGNTTTGQINLDRIAISTAGRIGP